MSAHSSGPWMAHGPSKPTPDAPEGGDWCIQDGGTNVIAETFYRVSEGAGGTRPAEANARLIAAAPEMLQALRSVLMLRRLGGMLPGSHEVVQCIVDQAEAVIASAEGAAP